MRPRAAGTGSSGPDATTAASPDSPREGGRHSTPVHRRSQAVSGPPGNLPFQPDGIKYQKQKTEQARTNHTRWGANRRSMSRLPGPLLSKLKLNARRAGSKQESGRYQLGGPEVGY